MATKPDLLPGTLDMLILKTLTRAPLHGYGIAQAIKQLSDEVLTVEEGSLYPALQRLLLQGWVRAEWKMTETNRRARYYTLTAAGQKQLGIELSEFQQMIAAISRVLQNAYEPRRNASFPSQAVAVHPPRTIPPRPVGRNRLSPQRSRRTTSGRRPDCQRSPRCGDPAIRK